ncbi:MAG: hypothetical protein WA208_10455 [Thermoanaerobaculia bacterium]
MPRFLLPFLFLVACAPGGATMVVENRTGSAVSDIRISAREVEYRIPELKPGEVRAFSAKPRGESGVAISYVVDGRSVKVPEQGYFEGDPYYVVVIGISSEGATINTTIKTEKP